MAWILGLGWWCLAVCNARFEVGIMPLLCAAEIFLGGLHGEKKERPFPFGLSLCALTRGTQDPVGYLHSPRKKKLNENVEFDIKTIDFIRKLSRHAFFPPL
jgi:hypothetical protein